MNLRSVLSAFQFKSSVYSNNQDLDHFLQRITFLHLSLPKLEQVFSLAAPDADSRTALDAAKPWM